MRRVFAGAATSLSRAGAVATSRPPAINARVHNARVHNGVRLVMPAPRETNASRVPLHGSPTGRCTRRSMRRRLTIPGTITSTDWGRFLYNPSFLVLCSTIGGSSR